jgi:hypothetical protein
MWNPGTEQSTKTRTRTIARPIAGEPVLSIVRIFRSVPMDSVIRPLRIEGLDLPAQGQQSKFMDAALSGDRAERFA